MNSEKERPRTEFSKAYDCRSNKKKQPKENLVHEGARCEDCDDKSKSIEPSQKYSISESFSKTECLKTPIRKKICRGRCTSSKKIEGIPKKDNRAKCNCEKCLCPSCPEENFVKSKKVCRGHCSKYIKSVLAEIQNKSKAYACSCAACTCYVCDDPNIFTKIKQAKAPKLKICVNECGTSTEIDKTDNFRCSCNNCICNLCDDLKCSTELVQQKAPEPVPELICPPGCTGLKKDENKCSCKDCVCMDTIFVQQFAPPPASEHGTQSYCTCGDTGGYTCSCKYCECYICDDDKYEGKLLQHKAPPPIQESYKPCICHPTGKPQGATESKYTNEFSCSCETCQCYICDDRKCKGKLLQKNAPPPVLEPNVPESKDAYAFSCSCKECECYICDDTKYAGRLLQQNAPPPKPESDKRWVCCMTGLPQSVTKSKDSNAFSCGCKVCECYICDDSKYGKRLLQQNAPPPKSEVEICCVTGLPQDDTEPKDSNAFCCSCKYCECYICDDRKYGERLLQQSAPPPVSETDKKWVCAAEQLPQGDTESKDPNAFSCSCNDCKCFICDDRKYGHRLLQQYAPPPVPDKTKICCVTGLLQDDTELKDSNAFSCLCKDCKCYNCDDIKCGGKVLQEEAPCLAAYNVPGIEYNKNVDCVCKQCACDVCDAPKNYCDEGRFVQQKPSDPRPETICAPAAEGFGCACQDCACYICDDAKYEKKLTQKEAPAICVCSAIKDIPDVSNIPINEFRCTCNNCKCYFCDDPKFEGRKVQTKAPAPIPEIEEDEVIKKMCNCIDCKCSACPAKSDISESNYLSKNVQINATCRGTCDGSKKKRLSHIMVCGCRPCKCSNCDDPKCSKSRVPDKINEEIKTTKLLCECRPCKCKDCQGEKLNVLTEVILESKATQICHGTCGKRKHL